MRTFLARVWLHLLLFPITLWVSWWIAADKLNDLVEIYPNDFLSGRHGFEFLDWTLSLALGLTLLLLARGLLLRRRRGYPATGWLTVGVLGWLQMLLHPHPRLDARGVCIVSAVFALPLLAHLVFGDQVERITLALRAGMTRAAAKQCQR